MPSPSQSFRSPLAHTARFPASTERRLSLSLALLLAMATLSVLAATNALSQHHAREVAALTRH
jgi:hypothetical protein